MLGKADSKPSSDRRLVFVGIGGVVDSLKTTQEAERENEKLGNTDTVRCFVAYYFGRET